MKKILLPLGMSVILLLSSFTGSSVRSEKPMLTTYQKDVITYFKEIALGFEFGIAKKITRKWKTNMRLFVDGTPTPALLSELKSVVAELNLLASDDFKIEVVSRRELSNFYVFFGAGSQFAAQYPSDAKLANNNSGVYRIFWNNNDEITRGRMFVNMVNTSEEEQRHVIREELTQALGLGRDSDMFPGSIFQSSWSTPTSYSQIDKDIIRLLYHPHMPIGLTASEVDALLTEILLAENGA